MTSQKTVAEETRALKGEANRSISFNKHSLQLQLHSSLHGFHDYDVCNQMLTSEVRVKFEKSR